MKSSAMLSAFSPFRVMALWLAGRSVKHQLSAAFSVLLLFIAGLGLVGVYGMTLIDRQASVLASKWLSGAGEMADIRAELIKSRDLEVKHSRTSDNSYHADYESRLAALSKAIEGQLQTYQPRVAGEQETRLTSELITGWKNYQAAAAKVLSLGKEKQQQDAADISDGLGSMAFDEALGSVTQLIEYNFEGGSKAAADSHANYLQGRQLMLALIAAATAAGVLMALAIGRGLMGQLGGEPRHANKVARAVAAGDLTTPIRLMAGDSTSLMANLAAMQRSLSEAVSQVRLGSDGVASASTQIAEGNQDLSGRTEQQASALQQTAATMDELGSTVRNNADNAKQANVLARNAAQVATQGGKMVEQVVATMQGINDSSRRIADIITVIDGIAFQTNILALNAAVEAARAGEQGRGFAVVASEVRSLAKRSADAAKEIKSLIGASVSKVEQGCSQVDQTGQTMREIVAAISRVSAIVGEISSASVEQSAGVSQVSEAVTQMDKATQQNAALVQQSASAAEALKQQAQQLVQAVAIFRLA